MVSSPISRFLLLGSLLTILVAASVTHPSAASSSSHTAAFVHPKITARGGFHSTTTTKRVAARNPHHKVRGESPRNSGGVKLHAAAKSAKKAAKKTSTKSDVESFKKSEFIAR